GDAGTMFSMDTSGNATFAGQLTVGTGRNMLANTEFRRGTGAGVGDGEAWRVGSTSTGFALVFGSNQSPWFPVNGGSAHITFVGTPANGTFATSLGPALPVVGGKPYELSAYMLSFRGRGSVQIQWLDSSSASISVVESSSNNTAAPTAVGSGANLDDW